jgi:aspartyl-tRNA(Asn)/glutamyl-tRNA(Gln) amidotransferase subunit B
MGLACNCTIRHENHFARKNYFYPDLPKGYQITQHTTPICYEGHLHLKMEDYEKKVGITRIHMEEDAGKSLHDQDPYYTLIDLNRAGVPLIEIVSEPDMRTPEEAYAYLSEIRKIVRYLDICDGNMEEGSLRCDANVSVRLKGAKEFGVKVEVKNMNSIRNVKRALEHEIERQIALVEAGEKIDQDTRSFDAATGKTTSMRSKEAANDYRYFPEPDLPPVILSDNDIDNIRKEMPELPEAMKQRFITEGLSTYDAGILTEDKQTAFYFEQVRKASGNIKAAANWVMGPVRSYCNENALLIENFSVSPSSIAEVIKLIDEGKINFTIASQQLFPALVKQQGKISPTELAGQMNLIQQSDEGLILKYIDEALAKYPEKVQEYKSGKTGLAGLFMGEVMKLSKGKADPKLTNKLLLHKLDS